MVTIHFGGGVAPNVSPFHVIDDFGTLWVLVPAADFFGEFDPTQLRAALAFERSGEVH
ncbi:hypothetical protein [Burkholderia cepacia]|uniref:hypothetical protein n=1 Tax=Burkholderia cepacia TaxID=292 RepID=UPI002FE3F403